MNLPRIPSGVWGWRNTTLLTLVVLAPPVEVLSLSGPRPRTLATAASVGGLVLYAVVLAAGVLLYAHWRLTGHRSTVWLVASLTVFGVHGISWAGLDTANAGRGDPQAAWLLLLDLTLVLGALGVVLTARRVSLPCDPVAAGLVTGILATGFHFALVDGGLRLALEPPALLTLGLLMAVVCLVIAASLLRLPAAPTWVRVRLSVSVVLLGLGHGIGYPDPGSLTRSWAALLTGLAGAVILCATALAWLRVSIRDGQTHVHALRDHLEQVEARVRTDRERFHEINATIAGIASASQLISGAQLPPGQTERLRSMVQTETARLERLMREREPVALSAVDLDATIEPLVVAQQVRGHSVTWLPSGPWAHARPDDVAMVVNILLNNAADHAPLARALVEVRRVGDLIEISVSDDGPGIPPLMRPRIFDWDSSGPSSSGQGIGLSVAERLMGEQDGYLRLLPSDGAGTVFVAGLWAEDADVRAVAR